MSLIKTSKIIILFLFFFSLSLLFSFGTAYAKSINTPTLLNVEVTPQNKLQVKGLTPNNSKVLIYIDGKYKNLANIKKILKEKVNSFSFNSQKIFAGQHHLTIVAQEQNSAIMSPPVDYDFAVYGQPQEEEHSKAETKPESRPQTHSYKTPAPILIYPHFKNSTNTRPKILGIGTNHTKVNIYLDGSFLTATDFLFHPSGTAGFTIPSPKKLSIGPHKIWAKAVDKSGKISQKSNILNLTITSVKSEKEISWRTPEILTPKNKSTNTLSDLIISGRISQTVNAINIYIDNKLYSQVKPKIIQNTSEFSYNPQDLSRGTHTLYITTIKNKKEGPASSKITFSVIKSQINKGVREKATSSTSTTQTSTFSDLKQDTTSTSSGNFLENPKKIKYILFGVLIIIILGLISWINKDKIKATFSQ